MRSPKTRQNPRTISATLTGAGTKQQKKPPLPKQLQSCSFLLRQLYSTLLVCQKPQMRKTVQRPLCRSNTLFPLRNAAIHCTDETNSIMFRTSHGATTVACRRREFSDSVSEKYVVRHGCLIRVEFRTPVRMRIWCATLSGSCKRNLSNGTWNVRADRHKIVISAHGSNINIESISLVQGMCCLVNFLFYVEVLPLTFCRLTAQSRTLPHHSPAHLLTQQSRQE